MIQQSNHRGFTLIELSIVLVIIGLIAGGILVGHDLINAAAVRAQIAQVEKYNSAVNTFRNIYGYLPGDIPNLTAVQLGLKGRGIYCGEGDGNGMIAGSWALNNSSCLGYYQGGEPLLFWGDLSSASWGAGLIEGSFDSIVMGCCFSNQTMTNLVNYIPAAKIGNGNYMYVWGDGATTAGTWQGYGHNYFGLSAVTGLDASGALVSTPGLSVQQAYKIDAKIDDGLPQSGHVLALYLNDDGQHMVIWAGGLDTNGVPYTSATSPSATSCFDNGGSGAGAAQQYSVGTTFNGGNALNCALSFQFQ